MSDETKLHNIQISEGTFAQLFKLPQQMIDYLWERIDIAKKEQVCHKKNLAGNISHSYILKDPQKMIYQTITMDKGSLHSYVQAYLNYYDGCFEGILFTRFLEEFNRMPTPSENSFIVESILTRFEKLKELCLDLADKKLKDDS